MPLVISATFTPTVTGSPVQLHGVTGSVSPSVTAVDGFRLPGSFAKNYQTTGGEAPPSRLECWYGGTSESDIAAKRVALCGLSGKICLLVRTGLTSMRVVVTNVEITLARRSSGSAPWRLEATLTVEYSP